MKNSAALLHEVSGERIKAELLLILKTPNSTSFIKDMDQLGILGILFPEILPMKGCQQNGFHHKDVWEHSLLVAKNCEQVINDLAGYFGDRAGDVSINLAGDNRLPLLKLTSLLHDMGKPLCRGINEETGRITFYKHDKAGAALADAVAERLKLSSLDRSYLVPLIAEHLHVLSLAGNSVRTATLMRWFRKMKDNAIPTIILGIADVESSLGSESTEQWRNHYLQWSKDIVRDYNETIQARLESKNLITGSDLISLGMEPGPEMGGILDILRNAQDTGEISNREDALALAKSLLAKI
jgi:poly(A) polymerase